VVNTYKLGGDGKAFITTLVAISLNPIGVALGYVVGKWLQAPKLGVQTLNVDAETEGLSLPKEMRPLLDYLQRGGLITTWRFRSDEQEKLKNGDLSAAVVRGVVADVQSYTVLMTSMKQGSGIQHRRNGRMDPRSRLNRSSHLYFDGQYHWRSSADGCKPQQERAVGNLPQLTR